MSQSSEPTAEQRLFESIKEAVLKPTNLVATCGIGDCGPNPPMITPEPPILQTTPLHTPVVGYDFNKGINYGALFKTYLTTGFQATNFGLAIEQIEQMVSFYWILAICN